jgi:S-adenosylmethionine synthetase
MSLEAAAGKNPVSHVGKIYNVMASRIAEGIVAATPEVSQAHCLIVSRIGAPISEPSLVHLRLATRGATPAEELRQRTAALVSDHMDRIEELSRELLTGTIQTY